MARLINSRPVPWMRIVGEQPSVGPNGEPMLLITVQALKWHPGYWVAVAKALAWRIIRPPMPLIERGA